MRLNPNLRHIALTVHVTTILKYSLRPKVVAILVLCSEKYSCTDDALMNRNATFLESGKVYFDFKKDIYIPNVFHVAERRREANKVLKAETFLAVR